MNAETGGQPEWLKPAEVAALLRCSCDAVYRMMAAGKLPAARLPGGGRRIRREDAEALLAPEAVAAAGKKPKQHKVAKARERRTREILGAADLA